MRERLLNSLVLIAAILASPMSPMALTNSIMAQLELNRPFPEFDSFLGGSDDTLDPTDDEIREGTNPQTDHDNSASGNSDYQEFQNCLSDSVGEVEISETEQLVRNCFSSSYPGNSVPIESPGDVPEENNSRDGGLPLVH